jgi:DNA primase
MENHFDIPEIKSRIKIWDVLRHFGHDVSERCKAVKSPLREEKHPSFSIFADGTMAKDHASGDSYDVILLYMAMAGCSKHEAIVGCGKLAGLSAGELPPEMSVPPPPPSMNIGRSKGKAERRTLRDALPAYDTMIRHEMEGWALQDLRDRNGILHQFCRSKNLSIVDIEVLVRTGIIGVLRHPALREPAIAWMFDNPHFGPACKLRLTADSSRMTLWWKGKSAEHLFCEQIIHKSTEGDDGKMMVTEGESDCIVLRCLGIPAVGVTGAGVVPDPRVIHWALSNRKVGVWYDNDEAGRKGTKELQQQILQEATAAAVFNGIGSFVPEGMDIGDCWVKWPERFADRARIELDRLEIYTETTTRIETTS